MVSETLVFFRSVQSVHSYKIHVTTFHQPCSHDQILTFVLCKVYVAAVEIPSRNAFMRITLQSHSVHMGNILYERQKP